MTTIKVKEIHCSTCTRRINEALTNASLDFEVSLENKTVTISGTDADVQKAIEKLDDLAFSAEIVETK